MTYERRLEQAIDKVAKHIDAHCQDDPELNKAWLIILQGMADDAKNQLTMMGQLKALTGEAV